MTEIAWVGQVYHLVHSKAFSRFVKGVHASTKGLPPHAALATMTTVVCLLTDGTVCEFRGWKRYVERLHEPNAKASSMGHPDSYMTIVHPFCTPLPGPTIATADQLGGESWLEWLRGEGLL